MIFLTFSPYLINPVKNVFHNSFFCRFFLMVRNLKSCYKSFMTMNVVVANHLVVGCLGGKKIESLILGASEHEGGAIHCNDGAAQHKFWCKNACHGTFLILNLFLRHAQPVQASKAIFFSTPAEPF